MNDESNQAPDRELGKRIASLVRSIGHGPEKQATSEERQKLKTAADRLGKMLKAAAEADQQSLRNAADRLDRLLVDMRKGNDVTRGLKRRDRRQPTR